DPDASQHDVRAVENEVKTLERKDVESLHKRDAIEGSLGSCVVAVRSKNRVVVFAHGKEGRDGRERLRIHQYERALLTWVHGKATLWIQARGGLGLRVMLGPAHDVESNA